MTAEQGTLDLAAASAPTQAKARKLVERVVEAEQDFEFYPTTNEIIRALARDVRIAKDDHYADWTSILDVGAGNGKVLMALKAMETGLRDFLAIEKSQILCGQLPAEVLIVGTEFDRQLVEVYELMVAKANVVLYKSNQRTFRDEQWRYIRTDDPDPPTRFALDYRIVTHRVGGVNTSSYSFELGLDESAALFLGDLLTIARNLRFDCQTTDIWKDKRDWKSGEKREFYFTDADGKRKPIFDVRGFKNRNVHLRLNQRFILALNVEHGRLKGWLRSGEEAAEELKDPEAARYYNQNVQLKAGDSGLLRLEGAPRGADE